MHAADDFFTTLNTIRTLPFSPQRRWSLAAAYTETALRRRAGTAGAAEVSVWGLRHLAPSWKIAKFLTREIYVELPYLTALRRAKVIFDVGANCGFATLFFKSTYPDATIVAIEPQKREADYCRTAVALNRLQGVQVINAAVGREAGKAVLSIVEDNSVISSFCTTRAGSAQQQETNVIRLSSVLPAEQVDLLKMDIEGAESEVLQELDERGVLTPNRIKHLVLEVHRFPARTGDALTNILQLLASRGYAYSLAARPGRETPHQDVLVYCSPVQC
jgi:FkbM family methyltransferase